MAYDSLVEKTHKEKKTNSLWALLPCDFALGCVCAIAFLGSWQSLIRVCFLGFLSFKFVPLPGHVL